jgi:hypothetical protein
MLPDRTAGVLRLIADSEEQRIPLRKITDLPKVEPRCGAAPS